MRTSIATFALCLLAAHRASGGQDPPDFSGTWILASSSGSTPGIASRMTVRESFTRVSVRGTPLPRPLVSIQIERTLDDAVQSESYVIGTIGGRGRSVGGDGGASPRQSEQTRFVTRWDGETLRIEITSTGRPVDAGRSSRHDEAWVLDDAGALVISVIDRQADAEPTTARLAYRRQP